MKTIFAVAFALLVSIWLWPTGFFDIPFAQMTLKIVLQFIGVILMALWGIANLYNRLGPHISRLIIEKSLKKPD